jgi:hypothetical protein
MGGAYKKATDEHAPEARQCVDPFHVIKLANEAIDKCRRWAWNTHREAGLPSARWLKRTRWALLKNPAALKDSQREVLVELERRRSVSHYTEKRVREHIAICVLAAVLEAVMTLDLKTRKLTDPDLEGQHLTAQRVLRSGSSGSGWSAFSTRTATNVRS